jgi:hypothetical protein
MYNKKYINLQKYYYFNLKSSNSSQYHDFFFMGLVIIK